MINKVLFAAAFAVASAAPASAELYTFKLSGSGISAVINLKLAPNPNTGALMLTSPNPYDPVGSSIVTGAFGTFADSNIGLSASAIGAVVASHPGQPEATNLYAPHSFGFYPIVNGNPGPGGTAPGLSYDDLFYAGGSPRTASDYTFHGGFLDIYGIVFKIAGGDAVNIWSNGDMGNGVSYGAAVTDGTNVLDYAGTVVATAVPEPAAWALLIGGLGIVGTALRRSRPAAITSETPPA